MLTNNCFFSFNSLTELFRHCGCHRETLLLLHPRLSFLNSHCFVHSVSQLPPSPPGCPPGGSTCHSSNMTHVKRLRDVSQPTPDVSTFSVAPGSKFSITARLPWLSQKASSLLPLGFQARAVIVSRFSCESLSQTETVNCNRRVNIFLIHYMYSSTYVPYIRPLELDAINDYFAPSFKNNYFY